MKSINSFGEIDNARKNNDHNVSHHLGGKKYLELAELAKMILDNTNALYNGIEEALELLPNRTRLTTKKFNADFGLINKIEENEKVFKKKALKIKSKFSHQDIQKINQLSVRYIGWANNRMDEVVSWKVRYSHPPMASIYYRLIDVASRLHESARSLGYSAELFAEAVNFNYVDLDKHWVKFDGMNYRYFIHSALLRIYGVYDKLGMVIQDIFEVELGDVTFEAVIEHLRVTDGEDRYLNSLPPLKICNRILSTASYKKLYDSRQDFFHLLVMQDFMNPRYKEVLDTELMIAIIDNCKMIYELIDSLDIALVHFHRIGTYHQNTKT
ncbi:Cthe_2314 family HEPN domain-containing protein [Cohnella rhizosphaerae]|uniref:Cthe_2314 family HEPN domain-containing protein n=1 Tax=Cohnella rhizosphaerae TaxID=1457232 RepID=A0A9X4QRR1_9BACL|nr:Cthe_2314 family HEPN domain-containing protein [Cohnella rhizosphaerae]MDG0808528.1 Cthe_2314 family HEPN domain-containing protein [Cohnella rhizosphaerae]